MTECFNFSKQNGIHVNLPLGRQEQESMSS